VPEIDKVLEKANQMIEQEAMLYSSNELAGTYLAGAKRYEALVRSLLPKPRKVQTNGLTCWYCQSKNLVFRFNIYPQHWVCECGATIIPMPKLQRGNQPYRLLATEVARLIGDARQGKYARLQLPMPKI